MTSRTTAPQRSREEARKSEFSIFGDPLWGIAIVSGILFAALAALMAVG